LFCALLVQPGAAFRFLLANGLKVRTTLVCYGAHTMCPWDVRCILRGPQRCCYPLHVNNQKMPPGISPSITEALKQLCRNCSAELGTAPLDAFAQFDLTTSAPREVCSA
jgi:hypothetical protein